MIDFRYHLVSIVSIFLALAVGIALGAGPLKGSLSNTITQEVTKLRSEKADLRTQLDAANNASEARDSFTAASNQSLLSGRLAGRTVALVVLPSADSAVVKSAGATLTSAGAKIGATVTIQNGWVKADAKSAAARSSVGDTLAASLGLAADTSGKYQQVDRVLAASLVAPSGPAVLGAASSVDDREAAAALKGLKDADLISVEPTPIVRASSVVLVGAPISGSDTKTNQSAAQHLAALASALDAVSSGAVLASDVGVTTTSGASVVSAARKDASIAKGLSTVDDASIPMGQASIVLGLLQQYSGGAGQYGLASDATAAFPAFAGA